MDLSLMLCNLDSMELQEVVCDVAQACACHVFHKVYECDGYDKPLFVATFAHTYESTLNAHKKMISDDEIPF